MVASELGFQTSADALIVEMFPDPDGEVGRSDAVDVVAYHLSPGTFQAAASLEVGDSISDVG